MIDNIQEPTPLEAGGVLFSFETERELAHVKVGRSESAVVAKHATPNERPHRASRPCRDKYTVPRAPTVGHLPLSPTHIGLGSGAWRAIWRRDRSGLPATRCRRQAISKTARDVAQRRQKGKRLARTLARTENRLCQE